MRCFAIIDTSFGPGAIVGGECGLSDVVLPVGQPDELLSRVRRLDGDAVERRDLWSGVQGAFRNYFEGREASFDVRLDTRGCTAFARDVYGALRGVGFGQTVTYGELAELAGHPKAARAVGTVLARNPWPLVVPCHRVLPASGKVGGFSALGGPDLKKRMLALEGIML